jgi:3-deoxy-manno-octulosonate cytidylyltransferase (CMP-KDO synthetase)
MSNLPRCIGIIPARYASQRFPGKPLASILGRPMFWHVYQRASQCSQLDRVLLATDDERIRQSAESLNVPVVMTKFDHPSGSDRVLEAARSIDTPDESVIVNIQGDEPALAPPMISQLLGPFRRSSTSVTTLARRIDAGTAANSNMVKVVFAKGGTALYFSRTPIPWQSEKHLNPTYYGHIGLYAYRKNVLERFVRLGPSPLEKVEKLEQLRLLENGIPIQVVVTEHTSFGVDHPEDLEPVARLLAGEKANERSQRQ